MCQICIKATLRFLKIRNLFELNCCNANTSDNPIVTGREGRDGGTQLNFRCTQCRLTPLMTDIDFCCKLLLNLTKEMAKFNY